MTIEWTYQQNAAFEWWLERDGVELEGEELCVHVNRLENIRRAASRLSDQINEFGQVVAPETLDALWIALEAVKP